MAAAWRHIRVGLVVFVLTVVVIGVVAPSGATSGSVAYRIAFRDAGTVDFTTDLGYAVTLDSIELTTYTVTLVACDHDHGSSWFGLFSAAPAFAGHGAGGDPAMAGGPWTVGPSDVVEARASVDEPAYCEGHVAFGAEDGPTLEVAGSYAAPGSAEAVPFRVSTDVDWGVKVPLTDGSGADVHAEPGALLEIEVTTSAVAMFDGVEFAASSDLAVDLLRSVAESARFTVTAGTAHG